MFTIIRFTPQARWYYPKSVDLGILANSKDYIEHTSMPVPLGCSRIGGPIVDLPKVITYPNNMFFAAQLNLNDFSKFDAFDLLPRSGFLYFFIGGYGDSGRVFFTDVTAEDLTRVVKEHEQWFWDGCLIDGIYNEEEDLKSRYSEDWSDEDEDEDIGWDCFAGSEKSKIYGIYTHCQKDEEEILEITNSDNILLLQIGSDFTSEGVWSVLIKRKDLENRRFDNCKFEWGQS